MIDRRIGNARVVELELAPPDEHTHISSIAFRNRFLPAEKVAIELAATVDPAAADNVKQRQATLRSHLRDTDNARKGINLASASVRARVQALEAAGLIAAGRAAEILDAPIQPDELP